jgi:hypothetical protein
MAHPTPETVSGTTNDLRRTFSYAGWATAVSSNDLDVLHWLEEFLSPWFRVGDEPVCDYRVDFHVDQGEYDHVRGALGTSPSRHTESFVRDGQERLYPVWSHSDGRETMALDDARVVYHLTRLKRDVRILAGAGAGPSRAALMRLLRELFIVALRARGALLIHGAAVAVGDGVVILAGPRHTGKTTLLLHLLQATRGQLVANDRVFVWPLMNEFVTHGVPTIIALRPGTLEMLPAIADRLATRRFAWALARAEVALQPDAAPRRTSVSPAQLCDLLTVEPSPGGPLAAIVFPSPGPHELLHVERVTGAAAVDAVTTALFGGVGPWQTAGLWLDPSFEDRPRAADTNVLCAAVAARVPLFTCRIGPGVLANPSALVNLVGSLMG